jgi:hypothetical protein
MLDKRTEWITALTKCIQAHEDNPRSSHVAVALYRLLPHLNAIRSHLVSQHTTEPPALPQWLLDRDDEEGFRRLAPQQVLDREIVTIGAFVPGGNNYASAFVITARKGRYSTHRLICQDDNRSGVLTWYLINGRPWNMSLEDAREDLNSRGTRQK